MPLFGSKRRRGIRSLLTLVLFPLMVPSILLFSIIMYRTTSDILLRQIRQDNEFLARSIQREISLFLEGATAMTQTITKESIWLRNEGSNDYERLLSSLLETIPPFRRLTIVSASGDVVTTVPYDENFIGSNLGNTTFFRTVKADQIGYWSNSFISSITSEPTICYGVPFEQGVLMADLNLDILSAFVQDVRQSGNRSILITDKTGTVIAFENKTLVEQQHKLFSDHQTRPSEILKIAGTRYFSRRLVIEKTGWPLYVLSPADEFFSPVHTLGFTIIIVTVIFSIFLIGIILFLGRRIVNPIEALTRQAQLIADGRYEVNGEKSFREAEALLNAMKTMAERIRTRELALQKSEQTYRLLVENAQTIIIRWNKEGFITYYNEFAARFFNFDSTIQPIPLARITIANDPILFADIWNDPESFSSYKNINHKGNGELAWIQWTSMPLRNEKGDLVEILSVGSDITRLQKAIREKEVLLEEVHHRVKNNLQLIISLLNLKQSQLRGSAEAVGFHESIAHIYSISLVHEQLYQSNSFDHIELEPYLLAVVGHLAEMHTVNGRAISFTVDANNLNLSVEQAMPCGLILTELVCNALRHAFSDAKKAHISIKGNRDKREMVELTVSDNGKGFPRSLFSKKRSLGFQLVHLLVEQLNGSVCCYGEEGTTFFISFPEIKDSSLVSAGKGGEITSAR
nr:cache domain-containing protein [Sediminispirochaeta smaragdinae]